ncbi:uncharacterized protein LOC117293372 [Asterias rubens]|uniref:uncharacterized protein LOC117293372 n=1 Tax=Asterias rubens TaxID=7604 RepID=UPI0014554791|nr:uncharacterized protein LOC117293372 [Asterias rubens]
METSCLERDWESNQNIDRRHQLSRQCSLIDEGMKGGADPLLSQEPGSVLPSYASLMNTDVGHDFSEDKLMNSGNLYSLYLLNSDSSSEQLKTSENLLETSLSSSAASAKDTKKDNGDTDEEIDVETDGVKDPSPEKVLENGHYDALFEGMPFTELKGKEVGPCAYCNLWRTIRFMSYCGRFPFCSVYCTKKFAVYKRERGELSEKTPEDIKAIRKLKVPTLFEKHKPRPLFPSSQPPPEGGSKRLGVCANGSAGNGESIKHFDWPSYLESLNAEAAPVKCFHHAPLAKEWKANLIGALIEVHNRDPGDTKDCFWVARVIKVAGYKAKLRFEGNGMDCTLDFWMHLCTAECYPVNGAEKAGKQLKPPADVLAKLGSNWREHTTRVAHSGSPTFSVSKEKLEESLKCPFKKDMQLEVIYKRQVSSTCVATVKKVIADRVYVQYENCKDPSKDFWFHHTSQLIHPVGWSQRVHHPLIATAAYKAEALDKGRKKKGGSRDAPWEIFHLPKPIPDEQNFCVGMKLEAIDPLKLGSICVATVVQTLGDGYLMIAIDGCLHDVASWFCYHATSTSLLPIGFCEYHQIELIPPRGYDGKFDWDDYLRVSNSIAAPVELFHQKKIDPSFRVGQKLEAVDLIESGYICTGTILKIAGPLLRVNFDGWDHSYDQWLNCLSPDIYPVGWCEMVGYPLQPPRIHDPIDHILPTPVCKNGKKLKSTSSLNSLVKRKRSLSGSSGSLEMTKSISSMVEAIYSFSDTEDQVPTKLPKVSKKDKSTKHSKKERKAASLKDKKSSKLKNHSKIKHKNNKNNTKGDLQALLSQSTPDLGRVNSFLSKKAKEGSDGMYTSLSESCLTLKLLPDSPLSPSLDSFPSLSNGSTGSFLHQGLQLDPLQMLPLDSGFQSVLAKKSCSSLMTNSDMMHKIKVEQPVKTHESANSVVVSSKHSHKDHAELSHKFPFLNSKHDGSKHKSKKSKKNKKVRDKDKSRKEKKCKKKEKEKKRKSEALEKSLLYEKKASPEGKTSKLAALLNLPGQIHFPDNKPLINGFLNASSRSSVPSVPPKPKTMDLTEQDPFAFETEQEIAEKLLAKQTLATKTSTTQVKPAALNSCASDVPPKKSTVKKQRVSKPKRRNNSMQQLLSGMTASQGAGSFSESNRSFSETIKHEDAILSAQPSTPHLTQKTISASLFSKAQTQSLVNNKSVVERTHTPALMELRKLPINILPQDAQRLLRAIQWQDSNLHREFITHSTSTTPFVPSRSSLPSSQLAETQHSEPAVQVSALRQSPQTVPPLINPIRISPVHSPAEGIISHRMPMMTTNPKKQSFDQLPRLNPQEIVAMLPVSSPKETHHVQRIVDGQNKPMLISSMSSLKRQTPTVMLAKCRASTSDVTLSNQRPFSSTGALLSQQTLVSLHSKLSGNNVPCPQVVASPHASPTMNTLPISSPHAMVHPQFITRPQTLSSPKDSTPSIMLGYSHHAAHPLPLSSLNGQSKKEQHHVSPAPHKSPVSGGPPGTPNITHRLPPLETLLKSLNAGTKPISPTPGINVSMNSHGGMLSPSLRPARPRLARPHSFPDASNFPNLSLNRPPSLNNFTSSTASFPYSSASYLTTIPKPTSTVTSDTISSHPIKSKNPSSSPVIYPTSSRPKTSSTFKPATPSFPTSPSNSQASCTSSFKLTGFQPTSGTLPMSVPSSKSGSTSSEASNPTKVPSSPSSNSSPRSNPATPKSTSNTSRSNPPTPGTPTESGPGCIVEEFTFQRMVRPEIGIMNPWKWGICEVIQFLIDAGERGCVETFSKQNIDGRKFMSLTKEQIAKLTGMKVAPSLKIYQQIVRLRNLFPTAES